MTKRNVNFCRGNHDTGAIMVEGLGRYVPYDYHRLMVDKASNATLAMRIKELTDERDELARDKTSLEYELRAFKESESALAAQVKQLVSDIHNAAIGYLTMGYSVDIESMAQCAYELTGINAEGCHTVDQHNDEIAVDRFGSAMKTKLKAARAKGRSGWDDKTSCSGEHLAQLLIEHLTKGNAGTFEDIANFSMMLHQRGEDPQLLRTALILRDAEIKAQAGRDGYQACVDALGEAAQNAMDNDDTSLVACIGELESYTTVLDAEHYYNQIRQQAKAGE